MRAWTVTWRLLMVSYYRNISLDLNWLPIVPHRGPACPGRMAQSGPGTAHLLGRRLLDGGGGVWSDRFHRNRQWSLCWPIKLQPALLAWITRPRWSK